MTTNTITFALHMPLDDPHERPTIDYTLRSFERKQDLLEHWRYERANYTGRLGKRIFAYQTLAGAWLVFSSSVGYSLQGRHGGVAGEELFARFCIVELPESIHSRERYYRTEYVQAALLQDGERLYNYGLRKSVIGRALESAFEDQLVPYDTFEVLQAQLRDNPKVPWHKVNQARARLSDIREQISTLRASERIVEAEISALTRSLR